MGLKARRRKVGTKAMGFKLGSVFLAPHHIIKKMHARPSLHLHRMSPRPMLWWGGWVGGWVGGLRKVNEEEEEEEDGKGVVL